MVLPFSSLLASDTVVGDLLTRISGHTGVACPNIASTASLRLYSDRCLTACLTRDYAEALEDRTRLASLLCTRGLDLHQMASTSPTSALPITAAVRPQRKEKSFAKSRAERAQRVTLDSVRSMGGPGSPPTEHSGQQLGQKKVNFAQHEIKLVPGPLRPEDATPMDMDEAEHGITKSKKRRSRRQRQLALKKIARDNPSQGCDATGASSTRDSIVKYVCKETHRLVNRPFTQRAEMKRLNKELSRLQKSWVDTPPEDRKAEDLLEKMEAVQSARTLILLRYAGAGVDRTKTKVLGPQAMARKIDKQDEKRARMAFPKPSRATSGPTATSVGKQPVPGKSIRKQVGYDKPDTGGNLTVSWRS